MSTDQGVLLSETSEKYDSSSKNLPDLSKNNEKSADTSNEKFEGNPTDYQKKCVAKLAQLEMEIMKDLHKEKQKLISIVLEKSDAKTRLRSLRQTLLEFQVNRGKESEKDTNSSFLSQMFTLDIDLVKYITDMTKMILEPARIHQELIDSISEVIRTKDLGDEEKIDKISDLLL